MRADRVVAVAAVWLAAGCASTPAAAPERSQPEWVLRGSGRRLDPSRFEGVGRADSLRSSELARHTADQRARTEIAEEIQRFVSEVMKAWWARAPQDGPCESIIDFGRRLSRGALAAILIEAHHSEPAPDGTSTWRSLARLPLDVALAEMAADAARDPELAALRGLRCFPEWLRGPEPREIFARGAEASAAQRRRWPSAGVAIQIGSPSMSR